MAVLRSAAAARSALHLCCVLAATSGGCGFARPSFCGRGEPAVEVVEDRFDGWPQLVGDLVLALALTGAASGLGDDDLEHAGERDPPQLGDLRRDCLGLRDGGGEGIGLAV
jgi:hypothetical protein